MKMTKDMKHSLLLQKLKRIIETVESKNPKDEDVYEVVLDFILALEHILKKILHKKNKLLIYNINLNNQNIDLAKTILEDRQEGVNSVQAKDALLRYVKIFPKSKLVRHQASIEILISNRNEIQHGINVKNMQSKEELLRVFNDVLPVFLEEAKKVLGVLPIMKMKADKVYAEKTVQSIYDNIVLSKITNYKKDIFLPDSLDNIGSSSNFYSTLHNIGSELCPRCSNFSLSKKYQTDSIFNSLILNHDPDMYTCSKCNLELTKLEYEAVQRLIKEGKIAPINSGFSSFYLP